MTLKATSAIFCDQIRQENNGKFIAIGIYSNAIVVAVYPAIVQLALLVRVEIDGSRPHSFYFRVKVGEEVLQEGELQAEYDPTGPEWFPIQLQPIQFMVPTTLIVEQKAPDNVWTQVVSIKVIRPSAPTV